MPCCGGGLCIGCACPPIDGLAFVKGEPIPVGKPVPGVQRVLILEFWATWCPPCKESIPHLTELQNKYKDKEVYFIGITNEESQKVHNFVDNMGDQMAYHVAIDTTGAAHGLLQQAGARGIPHAFIIDSENRIMFHGHPSDGNFESTLQRVAANASSRQAKVALPLITESYEELCAKPIKDLKSILTDRGIKHAECLEKTDLVKRIMDTCVNVTYYK